MGRFRRGLRTAAVVPSALFNIEIFINFLILLGWI